MLAVIKSVFFFGPLIFAFGFLAPLFFQIMERAGLTPPFGISPLVAALGLAGLLGAVAQIRGRWIW
jgi:hypothetical protein